MVPPFPPETVCEVGITISILDEGTESQRPGRLPKVILPVSGGAGIPFQLILSEEAKLLLSLPVTASCAAHMTFISLYSATYLSWHLLNCNTEDLKHGL